MKNITFSADEALIKKARNRAQKMGATLNDAFRQWLRSYVNQEGVGTRYRSTMKKLSYVRPGKYFSRDEMNER